MPNSRHRLTGADYFHLLIDRQMRANGQPGNISRLQLHLSDDADLLALRDRLEQSPVLNSIRPLRLHHRWPAVPTWITSTDASPALFLHGTLGQEQFDRELLHAPIPAQGVPVRIDLCTMANGSRRLLVSMHHALFDHRGMMLFLRALANNTLPQSLFVQETSRPWRQEAADALRGMFAALGSGGWNLATLTARNASTTGHVILRELMLPSETTASSDRAAMASGARMGRSTFYLACTLVALRELLEARGQHPPYFWVPVPHDMRRKGAEDHLVGNQLSFFFFKVQRTDLLSVPAAVAALTQQLSAQVRNGALHHQAALQRVFRFIPFWLMNAMVGLTTGGRISSLAFSDLGEERQPILDFLGVPVLGMDHIPPVPSPPGLSVVLARDKGRLKVILAAAEEALSEQEHTWLAHRLERLLTGC